MSITRLMAGLVALVLVAAACGSDSAATATFGSPADGATVAGAVKVAMSADGVTIEPAGEVRDDAGHFHVIADAGCVDVGESIGKDADHVHFGGGQSEGEIYLEPGAHELCLQIADGAHSALDITDQITVTVAIESEAEWCAVMTTVDQQFEEADRVEEFTDLQANFARLARLLAQLDDANQFIGDEARDDVRAALALGANLALAFTTATSEDDAFTAVDEIYEGAPEGYADELPGADWIESTCNVDLGN